MLKLGIAATFGIGGAVWPWAAVTTVMDSQTLVPIAVVVGVGTVVGGFAWKAGQHFQRMNGTLENLLKRIESLEKSREEHEQEEHRRAKR